MSYLNNHQVIEMAHAAVNSYEMTGDWRSAQRAAAEYSIDEFGVRPRRSAVMLAVKMARAQWQAQVISVKRAIDNGQ